MFLSVYWGLQLSQPPPRRVGSEVKREQAVGADNPCTRFPESEGSADFQVHRCLTNCIASSSPTIITANRTELFQYLYTGLFPFLHLTTGGGREEERI